MDEQRASTRDETTAAVDERVANDPAVATLTSEIDPVAPPASIVRSGSNGQRASQVYTWEPSNRAIAARYGLRPDQILRFDTNTSPAAPAFIAEVLSQPFEPTLNEYPDSEYLDLTDAAARYTGVEPSNIVVGAGADEVLDLVAKAYLSPGTSSLIPVPTYAMYGVLTTQRGARIVAVPRRSATEGFGLDLDAIRAKLADVRVVWLTAPNNPTGTLEPRDSIVTLLEAAGALKDPPLIVVDEAYYEFVDETVIDLIDDYQHLLVVRTVSKAFALPGIRVGYGVGSRSVIARLERVRAPGSISTISATLGAAALNRPEIARENVARLIEEREWLAPRLAELGWAPYPSVTNFLLIRLGSQDAEEEAAGKLLNAGIVPRTFGPANPLRGHLRLTVRSRVENERLLEVIRS